MKDTRPTLADAGVDKKLSARSQKVAAIAEAVATERLVVHSRSNLTFWIQLCQTDGRSSH